MSHTCVRAVGSAKPCLGRAFLIPCASSHRARPCRHRGGQRSCPVTGSFARTVFFASGCLVWVRWWAPWPRRSKILWLWSGSLTAVGLTASIFGVSGGRSTTCPTSMRGLPRPMGGASVRLRHAQLVSRCLGIVRAHGERCRPYPCGTPCDRAICNGRREFYSSPQSFQEPKRPISVVYTSSLTDLTAGNQK